MTLITGLVSRYGVWHVSDRLLTEQTSGCSFDVFANKTLLYIALDAIVAIGYTGVAFIRERPTDVWIAEKLIGQRIDQKLGIAMGFNVQRQNLISALDSLRTDLQAELSRESASQFGLMVTGWKWAHRRSKRPAPFVSELKWERGTLKTETPPRYWWYWRQAGLVRCPESNMPADYAKELWAKIAKCRDGPCITKTLVGGIQQIASVNKAVGSNCMTIWLPPPHELRTEIEFVPHTEHTGVIKDGFDNVRLGPFPVTYSPWVIGPRFVAVPAVMLGGINFNVGPWRISVKAQPNEFQGLHAAWSTQKRPARPRR